MNDERSLSPQTKIMIGFGLVLVVGLVGSAIAAVALMAHERDQCRRMKAKLERAAQALHGHAKPFSSNVESDPTGQASLARFCVDDGGYGDDIVVGEDTTPPR